MLKAFELGKSGWLGLSVISVFPFVTFVLTPGKRRL
jgi:hypothetical protein